MQCIVVIPWMELGGQIRDPVIILLYFQPGTRLQMIECLLIQLGPAPCAPLERALVYRIKFTNLQKHRGPFNVVEVESNIGGYKEQRAVFTTRATQ